MRYAQTGHLITEGIGEDLCTFGVRSREKNGELLATIAGHNVSGPVHVSADGMSNGSEAIIAYLMSVGVIEQFEMIHIEEKKRERQSRCASLASIPDRLPDQTTGDYRCR